MTEAFIEGASPAGGDELIQSRSVGEAIIVVHLDTSLNGNQPASPRIATVREKVTKASSKRTSGELSIPIETKKIGEGRVSNIRGGLAEICDDETMARIQANLFFVKDGLGYTTLNGNLVGLAVLIYDGSLDVKFRPAAMTEVDFNGWVTPDELLHSPNVREIAKQCIEGAQSRGLISNALRNYHSADLKTPVFPPGFSIERFSAERNARADVAFSL